MLNQGEQLLDQKRKVDFNTYDISVKELIAMVADKIIDISPEYQRQFRWKNENQSMLIESIFLGIPIPSLFMATNQDNTWEVIDGVQRLSTIVHFAGSDEAKRRIGLQSSLKLIGLTKLISFNDKYYFDLPRAIQLDFMLKPLKITTLSDKSDLNVRFDLFERLNTGGIKLTDQEIRSCIYRGEFNDFLKKMAMNKDFLAVVKLPKEKESDGTREEFVLRFFAFYYNYQFFEHSVVDFLNNFMKEASKDFEYKFNKQLFELVFSKLSKVPGGITRNGRGVTPVNLFEAVAVGAARALMRKKKINIENVPSWINSDELKKNTSGATNSKKRVRDRISYCYNKFLEI